MAKIRTRTTGNSHISTRSDNQSNIGSSSGMPKYIGALANVERVENGVKITLTDYKGTTEEIIYEAIQNIDQNDDGSLTFTLPDGREFTTGSLIGPQGIQGVQGVPGAQGIQGEQGEQGPQGERGEKGETGDAFKITKTYSSVAEMNADYSGTDVEIGQYVMVTSTVEDPDNACVYIKGSNAYEFIVDMSGATGIKGDKGDTGDAGPQGERGLQGIQGEQGPAGPQGIQGIQGLKGDAGNGIRSIIKTGTSGLENTYTITFTDNTTFDFVVTDGADGAGNVADVWVDGTSVLDGDTAKIDLLGRGYITSPNVVYCTCATAAGTQQKEATIVSGTLTELTAGAQAIVKFTNANGKASPTLKIGDLAAKSIIRYGTTAPSTSAASSWNAGSCVYFVYDGSYWQMIGWLNTTYSEISVANITSSSNTSAGLITGRRAHSAVTAYESVNDVQVNGSSVVASKVASITMPTALSGLTNDLAVSDFTNDAGYLTTHQDISGKADKADTDIDTDTITQFTTLGWTQPT